MTDNSDDKKQNYFDVSPNPFSDHIWIKRKENKTLSTEIRLYKYSGELIDRYNFSDDISEFEVEASNLPKGMYFYQIKRGNKTEVKTIIKK